jgi:hypothetical protein
MKPLAFVLGTLALALAASTPARADFALVQFPSGWCQVWWDSAANPWGDGWRKIAFGFPSWDAAEAALYGARSQGVCR